MELKIGDTLYIYQYGRTWAEYTIVGETRASWILPGNLKVDKKAMRLRGNPAPRVFTVAEKQEEQWCADHKRGIIRMIEYHADTATLRKIAAILGYEGD